MGVIRAKKENANHLTRRDIMICIGNENNRKQRKNVTPSLSKTNMKGEGCGNFIGSKSHEYSFSYS